MIIGLLVSQQHLCVTINSYLNEFMILGTHILHQILTDLSSFKRRNLKGAPYKTSCIITYMIHPSIYKYACIPWMMLSQVKTRAYPVSIICFTAACQCIPQSRIQMYNYALAECVLFIGTPAEFATIRWQQNIGVSREIFININTIITAHIPPNLRFLACDIELHTRQGSKKVIYTVLK